MIPKTDKKTSFIPLEVCCVVVSSFVGVVVVVAAGVGVGLGVGVAPLVAATVPNSTAVTKLDKTITVNRTAVKFLITFILQTQKQT